MGYFGSWLFEGGAWTIAEAPGSDDGNARWFHVEVYDSDWAAVRYSPTEGGSGVAYIGMTPRIYFEDESASAPTDVAAESKAIATWIATTVGGETGTLEQIAADYLADDNEPDWEAILPLDGSPSSLADDQIFVEQQVARFLDALGLGVPANYYD